MHRSLLALPIALFVAAGIGLSPAMIEPATAAEATVVITDRIDPPQISVAAGTTISWRNEDGDRHRIRTTDGPEEIDTGDIEPGSVAAVTLHTPGTYHYVDHRNDDDPSYRGSITVGPAGTETGGGPRPGGATGGDGGTPPGGGDSEPAEAAVAVLDRSFSPTDVRIATGGTVTWTNSSGREHTVTGSGFDSGLLAEGGRYAHTFPSPGTYTYLCELHPDMRATVMVGAGGPATGSKAGTASPGPTPPRSAGSASPEDAAGSPRSGGGAAAVGAAASGAPTPEPRTHTVEVADFAFRPDQLAAHVGDTVVFSNLDRAPHTATARAFDTGMLRTGERAKVVLERPGQISYVCEIHPEMRGTITVAARPEPGKSPSTAAEGSGRTATGGSSRAESATGEGRTALTATAAGVTDRARSGGLSGLLSGIIAGTAILASTGALLYGMSRVLGADG